MPEEGKKYNQLTKIKTISDAATFAIDNGEVELNTISFNDLRDNKLLPLFATKNEVDNKITVDNIIAGDNVELVKDGNNVTITSIPASDPAVLTALQYINGSEVLKDEILITNIEKRGGSINLQTNNIYTINNIDQNTTFILPDFSELKTGIHNQITVFFTYNKLEELDGKPTISFSSNTQFVNGTTIDFEVGKNYRIIAEFSSIQNIWIIGIIMNQETIY